jgi:hypothetical protein
METIEANDVEHDGDGTDAGEAHRDVTRGTLRASEPVPFVLDDHPPEVKPKQPK